VVALGGNAFAAPGRPLTMAGQLDFAARVAGALVDAVGVDAALVLTHGNGPQVGHMLTRVERALGEAYALPLEVCVAETEGELGYVLAQSLHNAFEARGAPRPVASLLTQVVVDPDDPAFASPEKPIGPFYDEARAAALAEAGFAVRRIDARGHRRVVPSPEPREIVDVELVEALLARGAVAIAAGGGGVPVVRRDGRLAGVEAVIDKDLASALLADRIGATRLAIVTDVPHAFADFDTDAPRPLRALDPDGVRRLAAAGHFPAGSMGPKMEAAARFAAAPGRRAVVTDVDHLAEALAGRAGTTVQLEGRPG
jgi:carbamate kinase